jgi:hypothetical protein
MTPPEEWPHHFIHTLEGILENRYVDQELHRGTAEWTTLQKKIIVTFSFEHENPKIDSTLKKIRGLIFIDEPEVELMIEYQQQKKQTIKELLSCYHVEEEALDEDDTCNIHIIEVEGEREVEGPCLESKLFVASIKVKKVNIGTTENPKMASIGDYWDEQTVECIIELLREYSDLLPTTFAEMKVIAREIGDMKIPLKPKARSIKQRPYRLNPIYKKKVEAEIDRMLEAIIIELVEESEWIIPMVVQENKQGGIRICVDLRKLNDDFLHDPLPTPFTDELLENVGGQEAYSFIDGFSGCH